MISDQTSISLDDSELIKELEELEDEEVLETKLKLDQVKLGEKKKSF